MVHFENEKPYVLLLEKKETEPKHQPIELGMSDGINVEIKKGLKLGDKVLDNAENTNASSQ